MKKTALYILIAVGLALFTWGVMLLLITGLLVALVPTLSPVLTSPPWMVPWGFTVELLTALGLIRLLSKGDWGRYGFSLRGNLELKKAAVAGLIVTCAINGVARILNLFFPITGHPSPTISVLYAVSVYCIFGPITEEIIFRGLTQSYLAMHLKGSFTLFKWRITFPALIAAILHAGVHIPLLFAGADILSVILIVSANFVVAVMLGYFRDQTGSLAAPILIHALYNVIGFIIP